MNIRVLIVGLAILLFSETRAQLISYSFQEGYTAEELDSFLATTGFSISIAPNYDIEVYQVIYRTPYKHIDSLVNASGIVIIPKAVPCDLPLACYAHGTFAKWTEVPSYDGPERTIGLFFAGIGGVLTAMPDELGLGDYDSSVIIHPYITGFHLGYASINAMRAARELADELGYNLSGEVVLAGYSEGGYTTMATHKLIQEQYSSEFNLVASAPMSGPYDLKKTMRELVLSDDPYPVPSYLPYLILGYHSVYPSLQQLYPNGALDIFKSPYDTLFPPLYYSRQYSLGTINPMCPPVPKDMLKDSVLAAFESDSTHPLRVLLTENSLLDWAPQTPVKLFYCMGDQQVSYLNAERAYAAWTANGATQIEKEDYGNLDHTPCVQPALTSAAFYLLSKKSPCVAGIANSGFAELTIYPNPASNEIRVKAKGKHMMSIYDINGLQVISELIEDSEQIDLRSLKSGCYIVQLRNEDGAATHSKLMVQ